MFRAAQVAQCDPDADPDAVNGKQFSGGLFPCSALCIGGWRGLSNYVGQGLFLFSLFFLLEETELEFKN